jgi:hypothetical protein
MLKLIQPPKKHILLAKENPYPLISHKILCLELGRKKFVVQGNLTQFDEITKISTLEGPNIGKKMTSLIFLNSICIF